MARGVNNHRDSSSDWVLLQFAEDGFSIKIGKAKVEKDHVRLSRSGHLDALNAARRLHEFEVVFGKQTSDEIAGRFVVVHAIFYCELTDDHERLWRVRGFYDVYDAAMQLGVVPKPGSLGEKALLMLRGFGVRAGR